MDGAYVDSNALKDDNLGQTLSGLTQIGNITEKIF